MSVGRCARTCRLGRPTPEIAIRHGGLALSLVALLGVAPALAQLDGIPPPPEPVRPTAAPPVPGPVTRPTEERPPVDPPAPSVAIRVRVPAEVAPDKELTYKLIAENCSKSSAHHVQVRVTLPPAAAKFVRATPEPIETTPSLVWKLGTLQACGQREITLVVVPTGADEIALCARVQFEHGQCVRTRVSKSAPAAPPPPGAPNKPLLQVRTYGPSEALLNDIIDYKLEVRNLGRVTAKNVVVREVLPDGTNLINSKPAEKSQGPTLWELGDLRPGGTARIDYSVVVKKAGAMSSTATVTATDAEPKESKHTVLVGQPALQVSIRGPKERVVGRPATYHLTVTNIGDKAATNVQLVDQLNHPAVKDGSIEFVRASDGGRLHKGDVLWDLGTLAPGGKRTVSLVLRSRLAGQFVNVCTVNADRGLNDRMGVKTNFAPARGLAVEIEPDRDPVEAGQITNLVVRIINTGTANDANIETIITLPEGLNLLGVPDVPGHEVKGRTVLLPKRGLAAGEDRQVVLRVQAEKAGAKKVEVAVTSDSLGAGKSVQADETITVVTESATSRKSSW